MKNKMKEFYNQHVDTIYLMYIILALVCTVLIVVTGINLHITTKQQTKAADALMENLMDCELVNTNEIDIVDYSNASEQVICTRNGQLLIVKKIGIVTDDAGNGKILNGRHEEKCDYSKVPGGVSKGDIVTTYLIYNPDTDGYDDILMDFNYITYHDMEVLTKWQ